MSLANVARDALAAWPQVTIEENRAVIPTHCLFGSGGVVRVSLESRYADTFVVHDNGAALDEFAACGGTTGNAIRLLRNLLNPRGFTVRDDGAISSPEVRENEIAPAIAQVANAAREATDYLLARWKPIIKRDFKKAIRELLEREFTHLRRHQPETGQSTRQHHFDFAIDRPGGGLLLIDAVSPDASAINATVIRNLDVRNANRADVRQRIIYDDMQEWNAADLNLLSMGATTVPFTRAPEVLERLAAA